jgi:hypothetical protein
MSVQISLHIFHKYCVQTAALLGNIILCNQMWSAMGEFIIFIRHIGGSAWWRSMHGASQPVVTSHHVPHTHPRVPRNFFNRPKHPVFWFDGFHSHPCNNAICLYPILMVSGFSICYLCFRRCVGQNQSGICYIILAVLRTSSM